MLQLVLALGFSPTPAIRCQARLPRLRYASARLAGEPGTDGAAGEDAESPGLRLEQSRLAAIEAYSWSVSRLSTSQDGVRDAYAWSIAVASNASAAVGRAVVGLRVSQFPALLPKWLTSRATREAAAPLAPPDDGDAAPRRYIETLVGANDRLYAGMLLFVSCLEMMGPLALLLVARAVTARRVAALPGVRRAALSLWVCGEAAFYVACLAVAMRENLRLLLRQARARLARRELATAAPGAREELRLRAGGHREPRGGPGCIWESRQHPKNTILNLCALPL